MPKIANFDDLLDELFCAVLDDFPWCFFLMLSLMLCLDACVVACRDSCLDALP